jgi:hypothetical protein
MNTTMTKETLVTFKNPIVLLAMGHIVTITCLDTGSRILAAVLLSSHIPSRKQASKQHRTSPPGADDTHMTRLYMHRTFSNLDSAWTTGSLGCTRLCRSKPQVCTQICPVTSDIWCMHSVKRSASSKPSLLAFFSPTIGTRRVTYMHPKHDN